MLMFIITVYLAVARCLCAVRALTFRNSITVRRTLIFATVVFILSLVSRLPSLAHVRVFDMFESILNSSRSRFKLKPGRKTIEDVTWLSVDMTSCIGAQIILVVCIGIKLKDLRTAAQFRSNAYSTEFKSHASVARETASECKPGNSEKSTKRSMQKKPQ